MIAASGLIFRSIRDNSGGTDFSLNQPIGRSEGLRACGGIGKNSMPGL